MDREGFVSIPPLHEEDIVPLCGHPMEMRKKPCKSYILCQIVCSDVFLTNDVNSFHIIDC